MLQRVKMVNLCLYFLFGTCMVLVIRAEKLTDFERKLDIAGMDLIQGMYNNYERSTHEETELSSDVKQIKDHSHHRKRRSVILEQVKAARKTGNREELFLRSSIPHKRLLQIFDPSDIVPIELTLDSPFNTFEKPKFFAVANYRNSLGSYDSAVIILRYNETTDNFTVHQFLNEFAPYELESFSGKVTPLKHKNFLSIAGYVEDEDPTLSQNARVSIYEISPPPYFIFSKVQELRQGAVRAMKYTEIGHMTYLILGMFYQVTRYFKQYSSPSQVLLLRFDVASNQFHFHSSLPGSGVMDIECFTVRDKTYLTVANYRDNLGRLGILSFVYSYNEQIRGFEMVQYLSTNGARDIEHFNLANEKYLIVANEAKGTVENKTMSVGSDVYKLSNGKFELIQTLTTYGAMKWKAISVPNCKQDVLLVYSDQRNDVDQVGIFTFSHDHEVFRTDQFSIYHLDLLNSTFRPNAKALSSFSLQDKDTGEYSLYLIVGATNTGEGNTIYKLSYEIVLTDSPLNAFKRNVVKDLGLLQESLTTIRTLLVKARANLADAVIKTGTEPITGTKTIIGNLNADHAEINILNITTGSMQYMGNSVTANISFSEVEAIIEKHEEHINEILEKKDEFMFLNVDQNVTSHMTFEHLTCELIAAQNVTVLSNVINSVSVSELRDIFLLKRDEMITGEKTFLHKLDTKDVIVEKKINGLSFNSDLVLSNVNQTINAAKHFTKFTTFSDNLAIGKVNGKDYLDKVLLVNQPVIVLGENTFANMVAQNVTLDKFNRYDMHTVMRDRVTKSTKQYVMGFKTFQNIQSNGDVTINGTINGLSLATLKQKLELQANINTMNGPKIFHDNVTVTDGLFFENDLNDHSFPENIMLKTKEQTIVGKKIFTGVSVLDVASSGEIGGLKMSNVVTLDSPGTISGSKKFDNVTLTSDVNLLENKTVNAIYLSKFISEIVTTSEDSISHLIFSDTVSVANATILNYIDNETLLSLQEIWNTCLHISGTQNITTFIEIVNNITAETLVAKTMNSFSLPNDFARTSGNQVFNVTKTFEHNIILNNVQLNGTVNDIHLNNFYNNIVTDQDAVVLGERTILGNVTIHSSLSTQGSINGLVFPYELMFNDIDQNITSKKHFNVLNFDNLDVTVLGDVLVDTTVDGVDLSELELSGMTVSKNETITGTKCFEQTDYNRSVEYINGVDFSALRDDIVTINTNQMIFSKKFFENVTLKQNLNTTSTIDGVDVSMLNQNVVFNNQNSTINSNVTFQQSLTLKNDLNVKFIDNIKMKSMEDEFVSRSSNETIHHMTVTGDVSTSKVQIQTINEIEADGIVHRSIEEVISGHKQFTNVKIENISVGDVNGLNFTSLSEELFLKDMNQTINGHKLFKGKVSMVNLTTDGVINGLDLRNWDIVRSLGSDSLLVNGMKTFTGKTEINHLVLNGKVNGERFTLFEDAVLLTDNTTLEHVTFGNGVDLHGDLLTQGNVQMSGLLNNINITKLNADVLKTSGEQILTSKVVTGTISIDNLNVNGFINGFNISKDLVTKGTQQEIRGVKELNSTVKFGNVEALSLINGVNLTDLASNTLFKDSSVTQVVTGMKSLHNGSIGSVHANGLVDGLNITLSNFVTLHTNQVIKDRKEFTENLVAKSVNVLGNVAGVNLVQFNRTRVLLEGDQVINSELEFTHDVTVRNDVLMSGSVNNIDVSEFKMSSPFLNETALGDYQKIITNSLSNQCKSLTYVKRSLQASATQYDYFAEKQEIFGDQIVHSVYFQIGGDSFLSTSVYKDKVSQCTTSHIRRWNVTKMTSYQLIPTAGAMKTIFFKSPWNSSYLLIINSKIGCSNVEGPSQLFKWNPASALFQLVSSLPTRDAVDAAVHRKFDHIILFISNSNSSLSSWFLTQSGVTPYSEGDDNPSAVHTFSIDDVHYLAVATRVEKSSSSGYVNIYEITRGNITKVQSIATKAASSITTFKVNDNEYLVIANDRAYSDYGLSTYYLTVDVYSFSKGIFEWFDSIPSYRAFRVATFQVGSFTYLAIVHYDEYVSFYQFGIEFGFQKADKLDLHGIRDLSFINKDGNIYVFLGASSTHHSPSKLLELYSSGPDESKVSEISSCLSDEK